MIRFNWIAAAMVAALAACGPAREPAPDPARGEAASAGRGDSPHRVQDADRSEITTGRISRDVVGWVVPLSELTGSGPATQWTFEADEYRRLDILERHVTENGIDILVFMLTRNNPGPDDDDVEASGQLRVYYEWKDRRWVIRSIRNLTFRYSVGVPI